mgnify:CR=1 FL=1
MIERQPRLTGMSKWPLPALDLVATLDPGNRSARRVAARDDREGVEPTLLEIPGDAGNLTARARAKHAPQRVPQGRGVDQASPGRGQAPAAGEWTVEVSGFNVPFGPQPFALVIDAAFGKIVSSLVNDIIMPPIGILLGIPFAYGIRVLNERDERSVDHGDDREAEHQPGQLRARFREHRQAETDEAVTEIGRAHV